MSVRDAVSLPSEPNPRLMVAYRVGPEETSPPKSLQPSRTTPGRGPTYAGFDRAADTSRMSDHRLNTTMPLTRTGIARETRRLSMRMHRRVGDDVTRLRLDAGISRADLAVAVGVHRSHIDRIEAGTARPSLDVLLAIGIALGADVGVRYFDGSGPRLHDRFQAPMIESFIRAIDRRWAVQLEVAVTQPARGVIDLVLMDRRGTTIVASEVQSELRRLEQQLRWANEKVEGLLAKQPERDHEPNNPVVSSLLILRSTVSTRELARRFEATLATAYPARCADVIAALTTPDAPWPGPGVVWMRVERGVASLLPAPPRGVTLGRR